jgi:hypothetical protein
MSKRPKINHLERQGLEPHPHSTHTLDNTLRKDVEILGRRSRKEWECSSGDKCAVGMHIDLDEVYVEHAVGTARYLGEIFRYHVACAITKQVVRPIEGAIDKGNSRRAAIQAQRARRAANAG